MIMMAQFVFLSEDVNAMITVKNKRGRLTSDWKADRWPIAYKSGLA